MMREKNYNEEETAYPDIQRIKQNYLNSYFGCIEAITDYLLNQNYKILLKFRGNCLTLYSQLEEELSKAERDRIGRIVGKRNITQLPYNDLCKVFYIMKHRLKILRITDIKFKEGITRDFR